MTILNTEDTLLMVVDIQEKLLNAVFNKSSLGKNASILLGAAKSLEIPVIVTEQYPKGLGNTVEALRKGFSDSVKIFEKVSFSAIDTEGVLEAIKSSNRKQILIFGIETHICVSQTASKLAELGYEVHLVKDASGSRSIDEHTSGIERMRENGVHVLTTEIALFEWLKSAKHPEFKEVQALIK